MGDLLFNPFEPVVLDRMDIDVRVEYRRDVAEIVGVSLPGDAVRAGDTVPLRVTLRPYAGPEYIETVPVVIPRTVAGEVVKIEVASGAMVQPRRAAGRVAARLHRQPAQLLHGASSIVVSLQTPDDGASLRGRLIPGLPASALDTLRPATRPAAPTPTGRRPHRLPRPAPGHRQARAAGAGQVRRARQVSR